MKNQSKFYVKLIIGGIIGSGIFTGCQFQDEGLTPEPDVENMESYVPEGNKMVLGEQLENPYSVENMRKALANLVADGRTSDFDIETTDLYIRFLPADSLEYDAIAADTTIQLFDHPLDFEIEQEGNWYHDPSIPDHLPTYQYTVVKPNYVFNDTIEHEILAELFIPGEIAEEIENGRIAIDLDFLDALEDESLKMTDNWEEIITDPNARSEARYWNPSGRIRVRELEGSNNRSWLPVENIKVRVRRWFTVDTDYTNAVGYYWISRRFKRSVNYSVKFETPYAKISNWIGWATRHDGPKRRGTWNVYFDWHSESWVRATLINAIVEYKAQCNRTGIHDPYPTNYWAGGRAVNKLNVRAVFKEGKSDMFAVRANRIRIYSKFSSGRERETDDLYSVTFHELGHQSHWKLNAWNMTFSNPMIRESYASFIEFYFINRYYPGVANNRQFDDWNSYIWDESGGESRERKAAWKYTALIIDLMDTTNQLTMLGGNRPDDNVDGMTFGQIQTAIDNSRSLFMLRNYIRDNYHANSDNNINTLFDYYIKVEETRKK